jgi:ABC-type branched-subunit amino acid transport system substrate-binding protein
MLGSRPVGGSLIVAALLAVVVAGCGGKDSGGGASQAAASGALKTGPGVTEKEIALGVLTDATGVYAPLGVPIVQGLELFWKQQNAAGGVCDRTVKLVIKDHGYDPQKAVVQYRELSDVAALQQLLGSPMTAALLPNLKRDSMLSVLAAYSSGLLGEKVIAIPGATYDVEMENGLGYLLEGGKIKTGDKIGHIYVEGDYGESGLQGSKRFAAANGLTLVEQKVKATDQDLTGQIAALKRAGVKAVALTTSPPQTASAVGVGAASGLLVPYVGNGPTWDPALLKTPAAKAIKSLLLVSTGGSPFNSDQPGPQEAASAFTAAHPKETPKIGVQVGWTEGELMYRTLQQACENQDLSRAGIVTAFRGLSNVDLDGLTAGPLTYTQVGQAPSRATYVMQPADEPGGLKVVETVTAAQ